jgi:hypothetical protein
MAVAILTFGIIPVVHHILSATKMTKISLRQVQASNHASNLMEALRAMGYPKLRRMPATMVQLRGNDGRWDKYSSGMALGFPDIVEDPIGDPAIFESFKTKFFADPPIVPELEREFTRYYYLVRAEGQPYVTLIVRVEWFQGSLNNRTSGGKLATRFVELRTVLADPFRGGTG